MTELSTLYRNLQRVIATARFSFLVGSVIDQCECVSVIDTKY
jgi:hypothetical protein